jgi:hypothetical protein
VANYLDCQSEDTSLLKQEIAKAHKFLDRIAELHNDCVLLSRSKDEVDTAAARYELSTFIELIYLKNIILGFIHKSVQSSIKLGD